MSEAQVDNIVLVLLVIEISFLSEALMVLFLYIYIKHDSYQGGSLVSFILLRVFCFE